MKRSSLYCLFMMVFFMACSKSEPESYEYWDNLVNEKYREINTLVQSIPCTDVDEFEIVKINGYYLVHQTVRTDFDKLQTELEQLEKERSIAYNRERADWIGGDLSPTIPSHPVRKVCDNGKPKLVYVNDLSIEEINAELPVRYDEIQTFYENVPCTDADQWIGRYIISDCKVEPVAVHKTIQNAEMVAKIDIYNQMMVKKILSEQKECPDGAHLSYNKVFESKPVQCNDGKPMVIED